MAEVEQQFGQGGTLPADRALTRRHAGRPRHDARRAAPGHARQARRRAAARRAGGHPQIWDPGDRPRCGHGSGPKLDTSRPSPMSSAAAATRPGSARWRSAVIRDLDTLPDGYSITHEPGAGFTPRDRRWHGR